MAVKGLGISGEFEGQALCALNMKSGYQQWGRGGGGSSALLQCGQRVSQIRSEWEGLI